MTAPALADVKRAREAGFSDAEIDAYLRESVQKATAAGFSQEEINTWLGTPEPNAQPLVDHFKASFDQATQPDASGVRPALDISQAFQAGFQNSSAGLLARKRAPDLAIAGNASFAQELASDFGLVLGDLPAMGAGALIGAAPGGGIGSVVTGAGGAFALPAALRTVLMNQYENGEVRSFREFWQLTSKTFLETLKGYATGTATGGAGAAAKPLGTAAKLGSEIFTMTTIGHALEGEIPEPEDFARAAVLVGGMHAATGTAGKLRNLYAKTGVKPEEVASRSTVDPTIAEDLASTNIEIPRAFQEGAPPRAEMPPEPKIEPRPIEEGTAEGRVLSRISVGEEGGKAPAPSTLERLHAEWIDKLSPIQTAVEAMLEGRKIETVEDAYKLARMQAASAAKADHFLNFGTFDINGNVTGEGLSSILKPVAENLDPLRAYLVAKRSIELEGRGIETGVGGADARAVAAAGRETYEPIAKRLETYQKEVRSYFKDSGMLSQDQIDAMDALNRDYTPFYRVLEDAEGGAPTAGRGVFQLVRQIKGSENRIVDPLESMVKNTYAMIAMAERNRVGRAFVELAEKSERGSDYARKVDTGRPIRLSKAERTKLVEKVTRGEELTAEQTSRLDEDFAVFRRGGQKAGRNQIQVFRDGKPETWEVQPQVWKAFEGNSPQQASLLMKWLAKPASLLRAGSVLSPDFMARNPLRDMVTAFIYGGTHPVASLQGLFEVVGKRSWFQEWQRSGGPLSAMQSLDRTYLQSGIRELSETTGLMTSARNVLVHPIETLRAIAEAGENATRVGQFMRLRKKGVPLEEAGFQSRDITLDFARSGSVGQQVNSIVAFFNAAVQGADKMARAFKEDPVGTMARTVASVTIPSVMLYLNNRDEKGWKEIPQWQKDLFWLIPAKGEDGQTTWWRLPKPFEIGILFGSGAERAAEWILDKDPAAFDDLLETTMRGMAPNLVPTAAIPFLESWFNQSFFLDRPIIPQSREKMLPQYQYQNYTTELTKAIGRTIAQFPGMKRSKAASPLIIDNFVRTWTGGLGTQLMQLANAALTKAGALPERNDPAMTWADTPFFRAFAVRYPSAGMESIKDFYDRYQEEESLIYTVRQLVKEGEPAAAFHELQLAGGMMADLGQMRDTLVGLGALTRAIARNPELSKDEKKQTTDEIYLQMAEIAKIGVQRFKEIDKARERMAERGGVQ